MILAFILSSTKCVGFRGSSSLSLDVRAFCIFGLGLRQSSKPGV